MGQLHHQVLLHRPGCLNLHFAQPIVCIHHGQMKRPLTNCLRNHREFCLQILQLAVKICCLFGMGGVYAQPAERQVTRLGHPAPISGGPFSAGSFSLSITASMSILEDSEQADRFVSLRLHPLLALGIDVGRTNLGTGISVPRLLGIQHSEQPLTNADDEFTL